MTETRRANGGREAKEESREVLLRRYEDQIQQFEADCRAVMDALRDDTISLDEFEQRSRMLYEHLAALKRLREGLQQQPGQVN
jgi:hypothetical protein